MNWLQVIIIAIVEGLTEFLPISSTGHMIIVEHILNVPSTEFVRAFTVIIQFGAILSVVVLYYKRFIHSTRFYERLFIAFIPAAVLGFLFGGYIDLLLENVWVVAIMLVLGGILMLFVDKIFNRPSKNQRISYDKAFTIGLCQCIAMIPGVSRSMATIVGGMSQRLTRKNAAEFSFFLAVPTMFAASAYEVYRLCMNPATQAMLFNGNHLKILLVGNLIAFTVALMAIKFFINFLTKYGFKAFGYYRIVVGSILLILLLTGSNLAIM
jgi:undecaprenyl-diphosphatase